MVFKCCVGGCESTSNTHRVYCFPKNDFLRNLWMSFVVPTNPLLIGLTKEQLLRKRICAKHFDKHQFDEEGKRLRYSYPCLFTADEIAQGEPFVQQQVMCVLYSVTIITVEKMKMMMMILQLLWLLLKQVTIHNIEEKYVLSMAEPQKMALKKYKSLRLRKKAINK